MIVVHASWILVALLSAVHCDEVERYNVDVVVDPSSEPYVIDFHRWRAEIELQLSCIVDPLPPDPVTYKWNYLTEVYDTDAFGMSSLGQNVTYTYINDYWWQNYRISFPRFGWFFCNIFSNDTLIGKGMKLVEFQGLIYTMDPHVQVFTTGGDISLRVNISNDNRDTGYIMTLSWYHNGTEIHPGERISVLNNGKELYISDMVEDDTGIYQVKLTALHHYSHNRCNYCRNPVNCEPILLPPLVENHALYAPVTFILTESLQSTVQYDPIVALPRNTAYICDKSSHGILIQEQIYPNFNDTFTFSLVLSEIRRHGFTAWYLNGQRITIDGEKYISSFIVDEDNLTLGLQINDPTIDDIGVYVGYIDIKYMHSDNYFIRHCCPYCHLRWFQVVVASVLTVSCNSHDGVTTTYTKELSLRSITGAVTGTFFSGVLIGLLLCTAAVCIRLCFRKFVTSQQDISSIETTQLGEMELQSSEDYETVPEQYQTPHDIEQITIENPIYDNPAAALAES